MTAHVVGHLYEFLRRWYGPPVQPPTVRSIPGVPPPLGEWYAAEQAWGRPLARQNTMLPASRLASREGFTPFYVENQGVWEWAFSSDGDPDVFDRENEPGIGWSVTGATLSEFLVHAAMFEAIITAKFRASAVDIDRSRYDSVVGPLTPVSMTPWNWPGPDSRLFVNDRLMIFGGVNDRPGTPVTADSLYHFFVAARANDSLAYLDEFDVEFTHNTRLYGERVHG